jgi:hypothetical protein
LARESALTRTTARYTGELSSVDGDTTANNHRVPANFDIFLTNRLFLNVIGFEFFSDAPQNVDRRLTIGSGIGYDVLGTSMVTLEVSAGAAYASTTYVTVESGDDQEGDVAMVLSATLDFDFPRDIEWDNSYNVQLTFTDFDKTSHHAESILSLDIWGPLELEVAFIFDRIEEPVAPAGGDQPKSNDYRTTVGLAIDF